jgi:hypothetical protein
MLMRNIRADAIKDEIRDLMENTINSEQNAGTDSITARKIGSEIGAKYASTQHSRPTGSLAAREAGHSASFPEVSSAPGAGSLQTQATIGSTHVDRAHTLGIAESLLPPSLSDATRPA